MGHGLAGVRGEGHRGHVNILNMLTPEETHRFILGEQAKYAAIVKSVGITPD